MTINLFSPAYHKRQLVALVQNESDDAIMEMLLRQLDPEEARSLLLSKIEQLKEEKCTPLFFRNVSLVKILPPDICKEIVEYSDLSDLYMICKLFRQIGEAKRLKRCNEIPFEYPFNSQSAFSRTWNLPRYPRSDSLAIQMENFHDGDTGLLKDGEYEAGSLKKGFRGASARLIGTGNDVIIKDRWKFKKQARSVLYFKNICFMKGFLITGSNKVWFEKCTFYGQVNVKMASSLFARKCTFVQDADSSSLSAIRISGNHNDVQVMDCLFYTNDVTLEEPITSSTATCDHIKGTTNISCNIFVGLDRNPSWMQELKENLNERCNHSSTCNCVTTIDNVFIDRS